MVVMILTGVALAAAVGAQAEQPGWFVYRKASGAELTVMKDSVSGAETVQFQYCRTETHYAVIIANQDPPLKVTAQHKLVFWMRGESSNGGATLGSALSVPSQEKSYRPGPGVKTTSARWRRHVFNLNTDFGLPDAVHTVSQIKFSLSLRNQEIGKTARVWIRDVAIVEAGDLSLSDIGRDFTVVRVHRTPPPDIKLPTIRVLSDMDNDDLTDRAYSAKHAAGIPESVPGPGYRHLLTLPVESRVVQVDSLQQGPEAMVVCRPVPGTASVGAVRSWVERGGGLLLYGACVGYEPLLPGTLVTALPGGQRQGIVVSRPDHPLLAGMRWKRGVALVPFGAFEPVAEASVLATFADGTPAVVVTQCGEGHVLFFNFGPGKSLTDAGELYDELALRALYWLSGRPDAVAALPEIDRELSARRAAREQRAVEGTLVAAGIGEHEGWRLGMSSGNVGRFGWAIDEGLLVGNINRHLQLTCGETALGFVFDAGAKAPPDSREATYEVPDVNWVCKTARVGLDGRQVSVRQSMLSPFVHYETKEPTIRLTFGHAPCRAAFPTATGVVIRKLDRPEALAEFAGTATSGWLLLWEDEPSHPLLLVFQKRTQLRVEATAEGAAALVVSAGHGIGTFLAGHPFGLATVDATNWGSGLPGITAETVRFWHRAALAYPVNCDEVFRIDRAASKTRIVNRVQFLVTADVWGTQPLRLAPLPPLVGFALDRGRLVTDCTPIVDTGLPTKYGMFKGAVDSDVVSYSLPTVPADRFAYVGSADEAELSAYVNTQFENGVRWSCGGGVPFADWTPETPRKGSAFRNINPFAWGFGLITALQGRVFLNDANRAALANRVARRFCDPVERHQYKTLARYREEPFSGLRYPVHFNSIYPNKTRYAEDIGSAVIYGDENEASTLVLMTAYLNAVQLGDVGLIRANWSFFRQAARMMLTTDDWAAHASGCREYSAGSWLDMLNCEYPGMVHYARVAEIAGDHVAAEQGYYRAAKRMLPTLMRLHFHDYVNQHGLAAFPARVVFGFNEPDGALSARARIDGFNCESAMDLTDFSQATCFALLALYATHASDAVQAYLEEVARPSFFRDGTWTFRFAYLKAFAFFGANPGELSDMLRDIEVAMGKRVRSDWPGMRQCDEVGAAIFRLHPDVYVFAHAPAALHDAVYADAGGWVTLTLDAPDRGVPLQLVCRRRILGVEREGTGLKRGEWSHTNGVFTVRLPEGRSHWRLLLGERDETVTPLFPAGGTP
ncbi:MAG: hypothetical protein HN976_27035 [Lentisphaerae bacterium]|jgi:hypothetical protein|nr:hypothetical protein [Lentisphaerota bacterium]MBT4817793.1 hypothetical protein [Lentisphaerota bacterium]MBT7058781.1 hypothetical protein [Lentisphaerota bacterium]